MSEEQKPTTDAYREGWQRIWGSPSRQVAIASVLCIECGCHPRQRPYLICKECLIFGHRR